MKKKTILYLAFVVLFVLYLCFANRIMARSAGGGFKKIDGGIQSISHRTARGGFFDFYVNEQDLMEKLVFSGWSFFKGHEPGERNNRGVALEGSNGDVYLFAEDRDLYKAEANTLAGDVGNYAYNYSVSTLTLPSDTYSVYVYCGTEGDNQGVVPMKHKVVKRGRNLSVVLQSTRVDDLDLTAVEKGARVAIKEFTVEGEEPLEITGWAYVEDHDTADQEVFMALLYGDGQIAVFDTAAVARVDVGKHFSNALYNMAGFNAIIPRDQLASEDFEVIGIVRDADGLHTSSAMLAKLKKALKAGEGQ